eukprot:6484851-Amphidinium_carterae.1
MWHTLSRSGAREHERLQASAYVSQDDNCLCGGGAERLPERTGAISPAGCPPIPRLVFLGDSMRFGSLSALVVTKYGIVHWHLRVGFCCCCARACHIIPTCSLPCFIYTSQCPGFEGTVDLGQVWAAPLERGGTNACDLKRNTDQTCISPSLPVCFPLLIAKARKPNKRTSPPNLEPAGCAWKRCKWRELGQFTLSMSLEVERCCHRPGFTGDVTEGSRSYAGWVWSHLSSLRHEFTNAAESMASLAGLSSNPKNAFLTRLCFTSGFAMCKA